MYRKPQRIISNVNNISNYIEGNDVFNSLFLYNINDLSLPRVSYEITVHEYRPDLIAADFYGDSSYLGILLAQTKIPLTGFTRGTVLSLVTKSAVDSLIIGV